MKLTSTGIETNAGQPIIRANGSLINTSVITFTGEVSHGSSANGTLLTGSYTKIGGTETNLIAIACINGNGRSAGVCGTYLEIGGVRSYTFTYMYDNWSSADQAIEGHDIFTGLTSGAKTITVGWSAADGGSNQPWSYTNPSGGRTDSRHRAQNSYIAIFEVRA
jgi:hypothetical protein